MNWRRSEKLKRAMDVAGALTGGVLALPVGIGVAAISGLVQGRPILFRQIRPGRGGRMFTLYKFRTMTDARNHRGELLSDEERLTPLGRWLRRTSLDEIPEFFNVLRGDMSLVGPRPLLAHYLTRYSPSQARRHEVKPGLTGYAQIKGRNALAWEDRLELDVWYVDHRSLLLDLEILLRTVPVVLRGRGVSAEGHATVPEFKSGPSISEGTRVKRFAILGGGIAGVTVAKQLSARRDCEIHLFEEAAELGGLQRSVVVDGLVFDIGTFVFTREHPIFQTFPSLLPMFVEVPRQTSAVSISRSGHADPYPATIRGYVRDHGLWVAARSAAEAVLAKATLRKPTSVPEYAQYYLGPTFYRRSGLRRYIERLYALQDDDIGMEFAEQRLSSIKKYTPTGILRSKVDAFLRSLRGEPPLRHLVRPARGFGEVYGAIATELRSRGVVLHLKESIRDVRRAGNEFTISTSSAGYTMDRVISTIPVPKMLELLGEPAAGFDYIDLFSIFYRGRLRHDSWLQCNFTDSGGWKKITAFSRCYGLERGHDYFTIEGTTRDISDHAREAFARSFEDDAERLRLVEGRPQRLGWRVTRNAYPVFHRNGAAAIFKGRALLRAAGIDFVGRQGNFEYSSSSVVAAKAREFSERLGT